MIDLTRQHYLQVPWRSPAGVVALTTFRTGGCSQGNFTDFNLAAHVGDEPERVARNRKHLHRDLVQAEGESVDIQWLEQVHGTSVVRARRNAGTLRADSVFTTEPDLACCVLTADCLPVFFAARNAEVVAMVHAGWRGLAAGILENTVAALPVAAVQMQAWLGPAIGPCHFQVGSEVREAFLDAENSTMQAALESCFRVDTEPARYRADLYRLATIKLQALGIEVAGGGQCTYCQSDQFFSFRRQQVTGRMASLIYLKS